MKVKAILITALLMATGGTINALSQTPAKDPAGFQVCHGTYALCTFSQCGEVQGKQPTVFCSCRVRQGYSVGTEQDYSIGTECEGPTKNPEGQTVLRSRYHPIDSYARCTNNKPWAMCLDSPCVVDQNDKTKASCACSVQEGKGDYVVGNKPGQGGAVQFGCPTGIISSATVLDVDSITDFLATQDTIPPVPDFKVINHKQK